jgi:hypothetical protein
MIARQSSIETKRLLLQYIIREITHEKESKKLAEIIHLGKRNASIQETLIEFFEDSLINDFPINDLVDN